MRKCGMWFFSECTMARFAIIYFVCYIIICSSAPFFESVLGTPKLVHYMSRTALATVTGESEVGYYPVETVSFLVRAAHYAFSYHVPLSLFRPRYYGMRSFTR